MRASVVRALALGLAALAIAGVLVSVVLNGRDGRVTDLMALVAVAGFVVAWRLTPRGQSRL